MARSESAEEGAIYHVVYSRLVNRNSLFGLIGITLLVFVVAFAVGRWTRPARVRSATTLMRPEPAPELLAVMETESTRLLTTAQTEAFETDVDEAPVAAPSNNPAATRRPRPKALPKAQSRTEDKQMNAPVANTAPEAGPAAPVIDTVTGAGDAPENIAPKTVLAKDYVAIEERQNYAALLPKELLEKGVEAKVNVVGELAEVIILSSPSFTARSQDAVIKQVCINLKSLGFKRVHITDGGDYSMHFGL